MISLQFITHQTERYSYLESARMALEGGCKWIQLRMKEASMGSIVLGVGNGAAMFGDADASHILTGDYDI